MLVARGDAPLSEAVVATSGSKTLCSRDIYWLSVRIVCSGEHDDDEDDEKNFSVSVSPIGREADVSFEAMPDDRCGDEILREIVGKMRVPLRMGDVGVGVSRWSGSSSSTSDARYCLGLNILRRFVVGSSRLRVDVRCGESCREPFVSRREEGEESAPSSVRCDL